MRAKKIVPFIVLVLLICMPFAAAQTTDILSMSSNKQSSKFLNELSIEEFLLYGGLTYENIGTYKGKYCIKTDVKPKMQVPGPTDYLVSLNELQLPEYGFQADLDYLNAQNERLQNIVGQVDNAISDESIQRLSVFADDPLYQNLAYGMYFTTIYDSLTFANEAVQTIGFLHEFANGAAMWLDYGYVTSSADITMDFMDYTETSLLFNGLMGQMEEYGYLEEAVGYAAGVLGGQMQQQAEAGNNIFDAHANLDIAGDSMQRADDFFHAGNQAEAAGKTELADKLDFMGTMNMAEGLASAGEAYKLKALVLLMLIDGTFRDGVGLNRKIGTELGPPCDEPPPLKKCATVPGEDLEKALEQCCRGCKPGFYIMDSGNRACFGKKTIKGGSGTPGWVPTPGGSPGPSVLGGAVAALAGQADDDTKGIFPIFHFDKNNKEEIPFDIKEYKARALKLLKDMREKVATIPKDYRSRPDPQILVQENIKSAETAKEALMKIASPEIEITPDAFKINGVIVQLNRQTGELVDKDGNVVQDLGPEFAHKYNQYDFAQERLTNLQIVVNYEAGRSPIYEKDRQTYLQAKTEELTIRLDAIDREYKFQITNLRADTDLSFEQRNDKINALYTKTNDDLINAIESTITDEGVRSFTYLIPDKDGVLMELIDSRSKTDDYSEITAINVKILEIIYPDTAIAGYYDQLKAQNMPFEGI